MVKRSDQISSRYLRKYASRSWLDIIALVFGVIGTILGLLFGYVSISENTPWGTSGLKSNISGLEWIIFALHPIIGFAIGSGATYSIYHGSIFILDITKRYWYLFVLALAIFIWYINGR